MSLLVVVIDIWTKTPLPFAHVNSWFKSISTKTCSGEPDSDICWIFKTKKIKKLIELQTITIKTFHSPDVCHKIRVLTVFRSPTLVHALAQPQRWWEQTCLPCCSIFNSWGKHEFNHCRHFWYQVGSQYQLCVRFNLRQ